MSITISQFTIDAYDQVMALWTECEGIGLSVSDSKENIRRYLDRSPGMSFIAEKDSKIIGSVLCGHDGRRGYIHHLAVYPDNRRQGIGRALVEKCLSVLDEIGIRKCHLFIFNKNKDGIRFWQNTGWTQRSDISVISKNIERGT